MIHQTGTLTPFTFSVNVMSIDEMLIELQDAGFTVDFEESSEYSSIVADNIVTIKGNVYIMSDTISSVDTTPYCNITELEDGTLSYDVLFDTEVDFLEEQLEDCMLNKT